MVQVNYTSLWKGTNQYWLPYSVGCLVAQAKLHQILTDNFDFHLVFKRENPADVLDRMQEPAVVCFSMYVWNVSWQLALAKLVRERYPECVLIFGGPSAVPEQLEQGLCDVYVDGEGELTFVNILIDYLNNSLDQNHYPIERISDITELPSPFTTGVFDQIVTQESEAKWQAVFETDRGCPYQCTFCDWGGLTHTKIKKFNLEKVFAELEWMANNGIVYMFCANANFGIFAERDLLIAKHIRMLADRQDCDFQAVNFQYLKNNTETAMQIEHILGDLTKGLTLSRQSDDKNVLEAIKRKNISPEKYSKMVNIGREYNVDTYTEFILPLPLETLESFKNGVANCLEQGQHTSMDIWPAGLLPKAEMAQPEYIEKYGLKWVETLDFAKNNLDFVDYDDDTTAERTLVVVATNTMSRDDTLGCYMFAWTLIRMHFCGYAQVVSRYLNTKHGIPYLNFYEKLEQAIKEHETLNYVYEQIETHVDVFLKTGNTSDILDPRLKAKMGNHFIMGLGRTFCYERRQGYIDLAIEVASTFADIPDVYKEMQRVFLFDPDTIYPVKFTDGFDILQAEPTLTEYEIGDLPESNKNPNEMAIASKEGDDVSGMMLRRKGYRCYIKTDSPTFTTINVNERVSEALEKAEQKLIAKG